MDKPKIILITGASSGIGKACAEYLASQGHIVYGTSRKLQADTPGMRYLLMDVCNEDSVKLAVGELIRREGRIDALLNNAGIGNVGSVEDTKIGEGQTVFDTNFFGTVRVCQAVLPAMREQKSGLIVNVSSIAGFIGLPYRAMYSASKFAVEGFTEALRQEVKSFGIKVCMIQPGDFKTPIADSRVMSVVPDDSPYKKQTDKAYSAMNQDVMKASDPILVAQAMEKLLYEKSPTVRYPVGPFMQTIAVPVKGLIPFKLFEKMLPDFD